MPELNDEFAKGVGLDSMQVLREKLQENLTREQEQKSGEAAEIELLEKLVDGSTFTDVPQVLLNDEVRRMTEELQNSVTAQGMKWEDYLSSIKKTEADMKIDFVPQALRRIQTAVLIKEIVKQQKIEVTEDELDKEIDRIMAQIPEQDQETRQRIISPEYREYVEIRLRNSKALDWLKKECIG
jgi:trigger factor